MSTFEVVRDSRAIKKLELFSANVLKIFGSKNLKFKQTEYTERDTGIIVNLPDNINAYYCSTDKNFKKLNAGKTIIYLGLVNLAFTDELIIQKTTF